MGRGTWWSRRITRKDSMPWRGSRRSCGCWRAPGTSRRCATRPCASASPLSCAASRLEPEDSADAPDVVVGGRPGIAAAHPRIALQFGAQAELLQQVPLHAEAEGEVRTGHVEARARRVGAPHAAAEAARLAVDRPGVVEVVGGGADDFHRLPLRVVRAGGV